MRLLLPALALFVAAVVSATPSQPTSDAAISASANPPQLSAFGFFNGGADKPAAKLVPYTLNTPLFSDYSEKQRFIYLPEGSRLSLAHGGKIDFPVGTALIKSFGYPDTSGTLKIIETRLLLHRAEGWVALPYVWRADGSDADLRVGGTRLPVAFKAPSGKSMQISYAVPNKNQCKQCHSALEKIEPIGPIWGNMHFPRTGDAEAVRRISSFPRGAIFREIAWDDSKANLEKRAQSYLRVNCGHCHAPKGSASNSGLILDGSNVDKVAYGIGKRPVAAGRASGDMDFIIEPGKPDRSILISRMKSTDPGIAMPEVGRATVHDEGVTLLEEWIATMPQG